MLQKVAGLALLILSISLLSSFISSLDFSKTGFEGLIGKGSLGNAEEHARSGDYDKYNLYSPLSQTDVFGGGFTSLSDSSREFDPSNVPLFFVEGLDDKTNYLRLFTASEYRDGRWVADDISCGRESVSIPAKKFKVTPIVELNEYLPVSKDTRGILPSENRCFDPEKGVFKVSATRTPYYGYTTARSFKPTSFVGSSNYDDPEIRALALKITANATDDFSKVKAIEEYLKSNYENAYVEKADIKEFLFETKRGTSREFATAFVLLAQSLGIPARAVFGYLAEPVERNQTIFASNAHVWAEVRFKEGWMEFDPSPKGSALNTTTEITYADSKLMAGENFTVRGKVVDELGNYVSGYVEIFLKKDKKTDGVLIALLPVSKGFFEGTLKVPELAGKFYLQAHFTGSLYHFDSWSDPEVEIFLKPELNVSLPEKVPTKFLLEGKIEPPLSGRIRLCVDGVCEKLEVREGKFWKEISVSEGFHEIHVFFEGYGYILPAELRREVEAGKVELIINETIAEGENLSGRVLFNSKPLNSTIKIGNVTVRAENGNFTAKLPLGLGRNEVEISVEELKFSEIKLVYVKRHVEIQTQKSGGKLVVRVLDSYKNPADGFVMVDGLRKELVNGSAEFEVENAKIIFYSGSERYFPAEKELSTFSLYPLIPIIVAAVTGALYLAYRRLFGVGNIEFIVEKEHPEMPNVWDVGEVVRIKLGEKAYVKFNGNEEFTDSVEIKTEKYGSIKVSAFKKDGWRRKVGEVEIKVIPYSKGIAEIVRRLEEMAKNRLEKVESLTGREIMEKLGIKAEVLLKYYEEGFYGGRNYTRKEFVEAFLDYLRVMKNES